MKIPSLNLSTVPLKKSDDLFEKSSMSFGEHLEELRKCLAWAFGSVGIGMLIAFPMANWVINYIQSPLEVALEKYNHEKTKKDLATKLGHEADPEYLAWIKGHNKILQEVEVDREELLAAIADTGPTLGDSAPVESAETKPLPEPSVKKLRRLTILVPFSTTTEALGLQEPFMIWMKAVIGVGIVIASPGIFFSIWKFVSAGLYPHERRYVYWFLPLSLGLFLAGSALAFFFVFQFVIDFLLKFNDSMNINAAPRLTDYMSFVLLLTLGFGISFQLPLVMLILERLGITSTKLYVTQWRMAILIIAFVSMILTPAEVMSMIGMCIPLIGLYFFGIALCHYLPRTGSPHRGYDPA